MRDFPQITPNNNLMKKLLFLTAALAMSMMPLTSCSKDEPTAADKALENIAGTKWTSYDKHIGEMALFFYKDGTYLLDVSYGFSEGTYKQNGNTIYFTETRKWSTYYTFTDGTISSTGVKLTIPMFDRYDGTYYKDIDFILLP